MITLEEIKENIDGEVDLSELEYFGTTDKVGNLLVTTVDKYGGEGQGENYYSIVKITREDGTESKGYGPITIGDDTWIANGCRFLKNTTLPNKIIVAACSVVSGNINAPEKSIIGSMPHVSVLANGRWLNRSDDKITYSH